MGTHALVRFIEKRNFKTTVYVTYYIQFDGYLSGVGQELYNFLKDMVIVNGFTVPKSNIANGTGCLAAQYGAHIKDGVGGGYIYPADEPLTEEYNYIVKVEDYKISVSVNDSPFMDIDKFGKVIGNDCL